MPVDQPNPIGMDGIEFLEFTTSSPQTVGLALEQLGFRPAGRHRSKEAVLYRQGDINIVIDSHSDELSPHSRLTETPVLSTVALRVRDAGAAYRYVLDRGAWAVPTHVEPMELNIPAVHGVGASKVSFVDRYRDFSIYDVDFIPIPQADPRPASPHQLSIAGLVQRVGTNRSVDWEEFYGSLFGFEVTPPGITFGEVAGDVLASPCGTFLLRLVEPDADSSPSTEDERWDHVVLGTANIDDTVNDLLSNGVQFARTEHPAVILGPFGFELLASDTAP